ncbi:hypothetical protein [Maridesulfovibrio sp. FT414]
MAGLAGLFFEEIDGALRAFDDLISLPAAKGAKPSLLSISVRLEAKLLA